LLSFSTAGRIEIIFHTKFDDVLLHLRANSRDKSTIRRQPYELPSASADGQCLKKDKALAESVK
jgi:hypothetical protein